MLTLQVGQKEIQITEKETFVRGTVGAKCKVLFDDFWLSFNRTVVFKCANGMCDKPFVYLSKEMTEEIEIPHEVLAESGSFKIGVYGSLGDQVLPTLWSENIKIEYGTDTYGSAPEAPTPTVYEKLITTAQNAVDVAQSVRNDADMGKFGGEKGEKGEKGEPGEATPEFIFMVEQTEENAQKTEQAYSDFLNQLGTDVPTLVGGKIPMSQIPATATQEIYTISSEEELTSLIAQRGDLAELIEVINGEPTITKTWQCLGDSSIRDNWVVWGTSYAVSAGNATTAINAENANTINGHRLIEMSAEEFESAVKDDETYYLVY